MRRAAAKRAVYCLVTTTCCRTLTCNWMMSTKRSEIITTRCIYKITTRRSLREYAQNGLPQTCISNCTCRPIQCIDLSEHVACIHGLLKVVVMATAPAAAAS